VRPFLTSPSVFLFHLMFDSNAEEFSQSGHGLDQADVLVPKWSVLSVGRSRGLPILERLQLARPDGGFIFKYTDFHFAHLHSCLIAFPMTWLGAGDPWVQIKPRGLKR
jgi:hypothetical protein